MHPSSNPLTSLIIISLARLAYGAAATRRTNTPDIISAHNRVHTDVRPRSPVTRQTRCRINQIRNDAGDCECAEDYPVWNDLKGYCVDECPVGSRLQGDECRCRDLDQVWSEADFACIDERRLGSAGDESDGEDDFSDLDESDELDRAVPPIMCREEYTRGDCENRSDFESRKLCCNSEDCEEFDECSIELCCGESARPASVAGSFFSDSMDGDSLLRCEAVLDELDCEAEDMVLLKRQRCCFDDTCDAQLEVCSIDVCCGDD